MKKLGTNFIETEELFKKGLVPLDVFKEIERVTLLGEEDSKKEDYDYLYGGYFYLVENIDDLKEINTCEIVNEKFVTLADGSGSFDIAELIPGEQHYVQICMMWSDAGGSSYFIPPELQTQNVIDSVQKTAIAWS